MIGTRRFNSNFFSTNGKKWNLDVLRQPADTLAVTLSHDNTAHEQLDRSDTLERNLALTSSLVQTELVTELILANGIGVVDLVTEDEEGDLGKVLHGEKGVEFGLGLGETLVVFGVDEEDDTANFGEVVLPETAGY